MTLTKRYQLKLSHQEKQQILSVMKEYARLWNDLIKLPFISAAKLQQQVQSKYNVHSDSLIALCQRLDSNRRTTRALRKQGIKSEFPYKIKELTTISGKRRQILKGNVISLSKDIKIKIPDYIPLEECSFFHITKRKNQFYLYTSYEQHEEPIIDTNISCGVDLGEIHCISSLDTQGNKYLLSGRELRSYKRYRNRIHKFVSIRKQKLKEGSKLHKRLMKLKEKTSIKTNNKNKNYLHHVGKKFIDLCKENKVSDVIVGNCSGVGRHTKQDHKINRKNRQKLSQFEYGTLRTYLKYKCELSGIRYQEVKEYWTTQTCPACGSKNKPTGRVYRCSDCGYKEHRDTVGSFNILRLIREEVEVVLLSRKKLIGIKVLNKKYLENSSSRSSGLEPQLLNSA